MFRESPKFFIMAVIFGVCAIFVCLGAFWSFTISANELGNNLSVQPLKSFVTINNIPIEITKAKTESSREKGLSGRSLLAPDTGLFFIFEKEGSWGIWMKDMNFPIDVVWITKDKIISDIQENMSPDTYPKVFLPTKKVLYVLEVPAGTVHQHDFKVGQTINFN